MSFLGDCAVRHVGAVLEKFETDLYPAMAARRTDMPVVPEGARTSTMNINAIHGGQPENPPDFDGLPGHCVPDSCRIVIDRRYLIEEPLEDVKGEVVALLQNLKSTRAYIEYDLHELNVVVPSMTDREVPVVRTVVQALRETRNVEPEFVASPGSYDQKHIDRIGKLKNCIAYGLGVLELVHKPDEWVGITDMIDSAQVMGRAMQQLLLPKT